MYHAIFLTEHNRVWRIPPFGSYLLAHVLRSHGYRVLIIDMYSLLKDNLKDFLKNAISNKTLFVGYSSTLFSTNFDFKTYTYPWLPTSTDFLCDINSYIKDLNPRTKIIFGGSHSKTLIKQAIFSNNNFGIDYAMHGYSEVMIVDFINSLEQNKTPKFSRKTQGIYEIDYDSLGALIDFKNSTMKWYEEDFILPNESLPMEVARGCIFKCKFCSYPLLGKDPRDSGYIKNENQILNEILENYDKFKTTTYSIVDDTFNENDEKLRMLLRIRDKSNLDLNFIGYLRLDLIHRKPHQIDLLYESNFNGMFFGIESMHHPTLKYIGKGIRPDDIKETLMQLSSKFGNRLSMTGNFIIGLPHETEQTFENWRSWVFSDDCPLTWVNFNPLYITQHGDTTHNTSEFFKNYGQYGYEMYDTNLWRNQYWDFLKCGKLALECNTKALTSDRQKIPALYAVGLKKYGYDYYDLVNRTEKSLYTADYNFFNSINGTHHNMSNELHIHFERYKASYIDHLTNQLKK